jgi:2,3-dihydroxy-2,3-dihydro-p-cumate dehydrogenase
MGTSNRGRLTNKVAIVTGGGQGIGKTISFYLAQEGSDVMISDLSEEIAQQTAEEIASQTGVRTGYIGGDLSKEETANLMVLKTLEQFGKIDILVNNAGGGMLRSFLEHTPETLKETIDHNLWTAIWSCRAVLPHMIEREYGRIINIGADSIRTGIAQHSGYNVAKGGVHGLTTGLAMEFVEKNIHVNTVSLCAIATDAFNDMLTKPEYDDVVKNWLGVIPMGRPGTKEEVASVVAFLASDDASFMTGQIVSVNGGNRMI